MSLRAVFFDLDGTLLDTAHDMSLALNTMLEEDGLPTLPIEDTRNIVSNGSIALVRKGYDLNDNDERIEALRQRFLNHYLNKVCQYTQPFKGIEALIQTFAENNIAWGIVTNKPWVYTQALMEYFSFASDPVCTLCPDHVTNRKPDPESLFLACKAANCETHEAIYIGDHLRDIQCGQRANMPTIAANYGFISESENTLDWNADHYVDCATEIWTIAETYR